MSSNLIENRASPAAGDCALNVGARDCHLAKMLAERFEWGVVQDLEKPKIDHPAIDRVVDSLTGLPFKNNQFDVALCAEVLEHISEHLPAKACSEIAPSPLALRSFSTTCKLVWPNCAITWIHALLSKPSATADLTAS